MLLIAYQAGVLGGKQSMSTLSPLCMRLQSETIFPEAGNTRSASADVASKHKYFIVILYIIDSLRIINKPVTELVLCGTATQSKRSALPSVVFVPESLNLCNGVSDLRRKGENAGAVGSLRHWRSMKLPTKASLLDA